MTITKKLISLKFWAIGYLILSYATEDPEMGGNLKIFTQNLTAKNLHFLSSKPMRVWSLEDSPALSGPRLTPVLGTPRLCCLTYQERSFSKWWSLSTRSAVVKAMVHGSVSMRSWARIASQSTGKTAAGRGSIRAATWLLKEMMASICSLAIKVIMRGCALSQ